ncbi:MAG: hypothetical protein KDA60_11955 [Planctomycetales bacterium]|nr:hypothetical protein [Planctomycetales bacterium]
MLKLSKQILAVAVVAVLAGSTHGADWGTLKGRIVFDGTPPKANKINVTKDVQFCGKFDLLTEDVTVNADNKGVSDVIIYLYDTKGVDIHPDYEKTAKDTVRLDNVNCRFEPHVCLLRTTQTLVLGNKDEVAHNSKVDCLSNQAINPLIPANSEQEVSFSKVEKRPVNVSCNIHPWMSATLVVQDHPYMASTDKDGNFAIENLPAGTWEFQFRHAKYITDVKLNGKKEKWSRGRAKLKVAAGDNDLGDILVDPDAFGVK